MHKIKHNLLEFHKEETKTHLIKLSVDTFCYEIEDDNDKTFEPPVRQATNLPFARQIKEAARKEFFA